jgi:predicted nucleic acid-binding protein
MEKNGKSVYIESTIPSYATARESVNVLNILRKAQTRDFWDNYRQKYRLCVSQVVISECNRGDPEAARRRANFIEGIEVLPKLEGLDELAAIYEKLLDIPERAKADCIHLAYCVLHRIDFLLSWNCRHLGSPSHFAVGMYNYKHGLWAPTLVTPETLHRILKQEKNND